MQPENDWDQLLPQLPSVREKKSLLDDSRMTLLDNPALPVRHLITW